MNRPCLINKKIPINENNLIIPKLIKRNVELPKVDLSKINVENTNTTNIILNKTKDNINELFSSFKNYLSEKYNNYKFNIGHILNVVFSIILLTAAYLIYLKYQERKNENICPVPYNLIN